MHLAVIGYGNIAQTAVTWLARRPVEHLSVLLRPGTDRKSDDALNNAAGTVRMTGRIEDILREKPDLVIECAGHQAVTEYGAQVLRAGCDLVLVSIGALANRDIFRDLTHAARDGKARLILPSGAIGGIDLLASLALVGEVQVHYRGIKPPAAWAGTLAEDVCDLGGLTSAFTFFDGTAREAAASYPKNANVAATLALAGAGFDATRVQLIADPAATGNAHLYTVDSPAGNFSMTIENAATPGNAKTSLATVFSVIREINRQRDNVVI